MRVYFDTILFATIAAKEKKWGTVVIVKIQIPLRTTEDEPMALIYTEDRSLDMLAPISDELTEAMDGEALAFFTARIVGDQFEVLEKLEEQGW